ncbi:MAG: T9SS type A sorting domain-containing protein [Bacteroidia bacterium]|nr:T9SS type A sorting domain-containing protein [Bacteroidia bacterium]
MKGILTALCLLASPLLFAQLYINGELTIQNGATLYVDDTITINAQANVQVDGLLHNTKIMYTNFNYIKTGTTGFVITNIPTGGLKEIGIGNTTNNRIGITHASTSAVSFKIALRDNVYANAQNNTGKITSNAVDKTWHIQPLDTVLNATINVGWASTDELTGFARNNSAVFHWLSGSNTMWDTSVTYTAATLTGGIPEFMLTNTASNLSPGIHYYSVGSIGTTLPVSFINVSAKYLTNTSNQINWQVANQKNGNYFEVQRSLNGTDFTTIKNVDIESSISRYVFTDNNVVNNQIVYYRIKQVDFNNQFTISKVVSVDQKSIVNGINIYPNPTTNSFQINSNQMVDEVTIYNNIGISVLNINNYTNNNTINISALPSGVYYVHTKLITETVISKLVVK